MLGATTMTNEICATVAPTRLTAQTYEDPSNKPAAGRGSAAHLARDLFLRWTSLRILHQGCTLNREIFPGHGASGTGGAGTRQPLKVYDFV